MGRVEGLIRKVELVSFQGGLEQEKHNLDLFLLYLITPTNLNPPNGTVVNMTILGVESGTE